jgi:hypothetical protein
LLNEKFFIMKFVAKVVIDKIMYTVISLQKKNDNIKWKRREIVMKIVVAIVMQQDLMQQQQQLNHFVTCPFIELF